MVRINIKSSTGRIWTDCHDPSVAITRAQALLVIIGDADVLGRDPLWRNFLNYVHAGGGWVGRLRTWDDDEPAPGHGVGGFRMNAQQERIDSMEEVAHRIQTTVLDSLGGEVSNQVDEDVEDRPWRDDE